MAGNLTKMLILCWKPEFRIFMYILKFSVIFFTDWGKKKLFSKSMLLRNIHMYVIEKYPHTQFKFVKFYIYWRVWYSNNTRECQVNGTRAIRIANFLRLLIAMVGAD